VTRLRSHRWVTLIWQWWVFDPVVNCYCWISIFNGNWQNKTFFYVICWLLSVFIEA
jgi:hypothetical protein